MTGSTSYSSVTEDILPKELTQTNFRRGKWTVEEENYTSRIIKDFENGSLSLISSLHLILFYFTCLYFLRSHVLFPNLTS